MTSKITVVTVCYNAENDIESTMRSTLEQDYVDLEYIIIDGKSKDKTLEIINKVKYENHARNVKVVSEPDQGIYDAMNKGINLATGEFLVFMNAGDFFYDKTTLTKVIKYLKNNPSTDVLYGNCGFTTEDTIQHPSPFWKREKGYQGVGFCHQATYVRVSILKKYPFNLKYTISADYDQMFQLYKSGCKFSYFNMPLCKFNLYGVSYSFENRIELYAQNAEISSEQASLAYKFAILKLNLIRILPTCIQRIILSRVSLKDRNR
ncbi:glycosyltransferase family 2 protein [Segatella bryantii]|uniref:glycosyltransferase family 2 protein n=1 Tax=Segatella bryantii TaxID=77095 RepID=UPI002853064B|nr:glycosyltransferase family 2 protein [Segatella bryantii]MDR4931329.1 glycosyltransferase family 2 protein [Segatella bryantii]